MAGDVSPRCYYRLDLASHTLVLCDEGPPESACRRFIATTQVLQRAGVRVPHIHEQRVDDGLLLLEDFGDLPLAQLRSGHPATDSTWRQAAEHLTRIAALPADLIAAINPPLGEELMGREIEQTLSVALAPHLQDVGLLNAVAEALRAVCHELGCGPLLPAHRDYMGRNLMALDNEVGVLDHQDLRLAPPHYDLASLLFDSSRLSREERSRFLAAVEGARVEFDRALAQRLFKIIGTFFAFARRGYPRHLGMVPAALREGWRALLAIPEGNNLRSGRRVSPPEAFSGLLAAAGETQPRTELASLLLTPSPAGSG